jgi:hypothetical protein
MVKDMPDSATQSASSPPMEIYHGFEITPVGRRSDPKARILDLFVSSPEL